MGETMSPPIVSKNLLLAAAARLISGSELKVGSALLWRCRPPGGEVARVSYSRLAKLAGVARSTAVQAVARLRELGLLVREKTRLRVRWSLGVASRQGCNLYRWSRVASTESDHRPVIQMQVSKKEGASSKVAAPPVPRRGGVSDLSAALASLGARIAAANRG
jgi:hypothetical protein